jgi:hypothetical protein
MTPRTERMDLTRLSPRQCRLLQRLSASPTAWTSEHTLFGADRCSVAALVQRDLVRARTRVYVARVGRRYECTETLYRLSWLGRTVARGLRAAGEGLTA